MASKSDILAPKKNYNFNNRAYACFSPKMMQSYVSIFFPEMHQNSSTTIKDFKNFPWRKPPTPALVIL